MKDIYDDIRAAVAKAEARALKARIRKLAAEQNRHDARKAEIHRETGEALAKARAALALIPKEANPILMSDAEAEQLDDELGDPPVVDDEPSMVEVPAALQRPYAPSERLTGKARER